jgi:hypothetical protein
MGCAGPDDPDGRERRRREVPLSAISGAEQASLLGPVIKPVRRVETTVLRERPGPPSATPRRSPYSLVRTTVDDTPALVPLLRCSAAPRVGGSGPAPTRRPVRRRRRRRTATAPRSRRPQGRSRQAWASRGRLPTWSGLTLRCLQPHRERVLAPPRSTKPPWRSIDAADVPAGPSRLSTRTPLRLTSRLPSAGSARAA